MAGLPAALLHSRTADRTKLEYRLARANEREAQFERIRTRIVSDVTGLSERLFNVQVTIPTQMRPFVSGWIGGAAGIFVTHPIDTVRVWKQFRPGHNSYSSIVGDLYRTRGIFGGFYGVIPPVLFRGGSMAINRATYGWTTEWLRIADNPQERHWRLFVAGGISGLCTGLADTPIYLVKTRAQALAGENFKESLRTYFTMAGQVARTEGLSTFFTGSIPAMICGSCFAVFYVVYEELIERKVPTVYAGGFAAMCSWAPAMPFDTIRVRMQCNPGLSFTAASKQLFSQPVAKWFVGMGATMIRTAPRFAVNMYCIESMRAYMSKGDQLKT